MLPTSAAPPARPHHLPRQSRQQSRQHRPSPRRLLRLGALATVFATVLAAPASSVPADGAQAARGAATSTAPAASEVGLLPLKRPGTTVSTVRGPSREVGMRFSSKAAGRAIGIRYYKPGARKSTTPRTATLWSASGKVLARKELRRTGRRGWRTVTFASAVTLDPSRTYVVSVHTRSQGVHAATRYGFRKALSNAYLRAPGDHNGVTRKGATSRFPRKQAPRDSNYWVDVRFVPTAPPTTTPTPTDSRWPGPDNTGVPAGTALTPYTGPCTITSARTITAVDATGACDALVINTTGVVIEKSLVPRVQSIFGDGDSSVTITDSDVRAGDTPTGALWGYNITARRVDATGGQHSFHCNDNCVVEDSWLHDQYNPDGESFHNNAFISNGGRNMLVRHNTLHCTAILNSNDGGCTADVSLFGDFDPIDDVHIDNNLLKANGSSISYCAYGGASKSLKATNVRFTNNVFERGANRRCGVYGPVTDFDRGATGNVWSGNVWDSGEAVNP